jgi:hypothetical protein
VFQSESLGVMAAEISDKSSLKVGKVSYAASQSLVDENEDSLYNDSFQKMNMTVSFNISDY